MDKFPAWLDLIQSLSGLALVLFLWTHMLLVSSILLGHDAMYIVARFFEGQYFFGAPYPILVSLIAAIILLLVVVHALLALRKFPASYQQYQNFSQHMHLIKHSDTTFWYVQVITGFALFFLTTIHLYSIMTHPAEIGPYASADRVWTDMMWPLYLVLLFIVELHAGIGLYRLAIKWGWPRGSDPRNTRVKLKKLKWILTIFFICLGSLTLLAYVKIGIDHQDKAGERYQPSPSLSVFSFSRLRERVGVRDHVT